MPIGTDFMADSPLSAFPALLTALGRLQRLSLAPDHVRRALLAAQVSPALVDAIVAEVCAPTVIPDKTAEEVMS